MTTLNLQALYENLQKDAAKRENTGSGPRSAYRTLFIKPDHRAKLNVRILFNVAANAVTYTYKIHKMADGKTLLCGKNNRNNEHCELCDALAARKAVTGVDQKEVASSRTIMFAQYISSTGYDFSDKYPEPKRGDTIIVMGPYSLHNMVSETLSTAGMEFLPKLLTDVVGHGVVISRDTQDRQITVNTSLATFQSAQTQEQFQTLLQQLPHLEKIALNGGLTEEDITTLKTAAAAVMRTIQTQQPVTTAQPSVEQMLNTAATVSSPAVQSLTAQQIYEAQQQVQRQVPNIGEQVLPSQQWATPQGTAPVDTPLSPELGVTPPQQAQVEQENDVLKRLLSDLGDINSDKSPF